MRRQILWLAVVAVTACGGGDLSPRDGRDARRGPVTDGALPSAGVDPAGDRSEPVHSPPPLVPEVQGPEAAPGGAAATPAAAEKPPEGPMSPPGGPGAATGLQSETGCKTEDPGEAFADLSWTVAEQRGTEQRVAVTIFRDGFDTGNYEVSEPLDPGQSSLRWERFHGQAIHFWRVLTFHDTGWTPSETANFEGPTCIRDSDEEAPPRGPG